MSYKNKQIIEYETFDYYSIDPIDINDLYNKDKNLLEPLLKNKSLFALCIERLNNEYIGTNGIWYFYDLPDDDPTEFKYEIHFNNIISEHKIPMDRCSLHFGISKISLEDYLKNYDFYNNINGPFLIIADECDIEKIDNIIKLLVHDLVNLNKDYFSKTAFLKALESSELNNLCTIIWLNDDSEFKTITILHKDVD